MSKSLQLLLVILVIVVKEISSQKCTFKWENGSAIPEDKTKWPIGMADIEDIEPPETTLLTLIGENVESILSITTDSESQLLYMEPTLQGSTIVIKLTQNFVHFEEHETRSSTSITITFNCITDTAKLEFRQPIIDTNNHDPEFVNAPYTYTLPIPFPSDFRLDLLGSIAARDIDLKNTKISFSLDPLEPVSAALEATWLSVSPTDQKLHYASLKTKSVLQLMDGITFPIYATDSGTPPRTVNTTVTINVDEKNSVMRFTRPIYSANCTNLIPEEADGLILEFDRGDITISGGSDGTIDWSVEDLAGKYDDVFKINSSVNPHTVKITLDQPPSSFFRESVVLVILNVQKAGAMESTILRVMLPGSRSQGNSDVAPKEDSATSTPIIIALSVLLAIAVVGLIVTIVLIRRRATVAKRREATNEGPATREDMAEVERMENDSSSNGVARRSVAFNDTVEEIKVARL